MLLGSIPTAYPQGTDGPAIKIISGKSFGVESPVRPLGGCWYFDVSFKKAGQSVFQDIRECYLSSSGVVRRILMLWVGGLQPADGLLSYIVSLPYQGLRVGS